MNFTRHSGDICMADKHIVYTTKSKFYLKISLSINSKDSDICIWIKEKPYKLCDNLYGSDFDNLNNYLIAVCLHRTGVSSSKKHLSLDQFYSS